MIERYKNVEIGCSGRHDNEEFLHWIYRLTLFLANGAGSAIDEDETKSFGNNIEISIVFIFPSLSISVYIRETDVSN